MRLDEPAVDLAVALALVSGVRDKAIPEDTVVFGEIGLSGEIRSVPQISQRVKEASRLGFSKCIVPKICLKQLNSIKNEIELIGVGTLSEALKLIK